MSEISLKDQGHTAKPIPIHLLMRKQSILFLLAVTLSFTTVIVNAQSQPSRTLRHVVMVTFKNGAPAKDISEVDDSFKNLADKLNVVKSYEMGVALTDGQLKTSTHVYSFSFASEKDLASYGASPEHQQHIKIGKAVIERVQAVDYWVEK